jgi:hypothetical protein
LNRCGIAAVRTGRKSVIINSSLPQRHAGYRSFGEKTRGGEKFTG